jgi:hypothetical protein
VVYPFVHVSSNGSVANCVVFTGNAVWIGNLPPQTDLMTLVRHVSKETNGLESLFLIAKSNCAFANFKDEASCIAAQVKLHESRFQSVRLVSRLRKNDLDGSAGPSPPTGPASGPGNSSRSTSQAASNSAVKVDGVSSTATVDGAEHPVATVPDAAAKHHDRFFILKSLTVDDLELSVRTGIWATQPHNEETLTDAFKVRGDRITSHSRCHLHLLTRENSNVAMCT